MKLKKMQNQKRKSKKIIKTMIKIKLPKKLRVHQLLKGKRIKQKGMLKKNKLKGKGNELWKKKTKWHLNLLVLLLQMLNLKTNKQSQPIIKTLMMKMNRKTKLFLKILRIDY